jgi:hypothetical protein
MKIIFALATLAVCLPGGVSRLSAEDVVAFRNFQARGGFLVTACKNARRVCHVEIQSRRDHPCQVMNPCPDKPVVDHEADRTEPGPIQVDKSNGECVVFATRAGHTYSLEQTGG